MFVGCFLAPQEVLNIPLALPWPRTKLFLMDCRKSPSNTFVTVRNVINDFFLLFLMDWDGFRSVRSVCGCLWSGFGPSGGFQEGLRSCSGKTIKNHEKS